MKEFLIEKKGANKLIITDIRKTSLYLGYLGIIMFFVWNALILNRHFRAEQGFISSFLYDCKTHTFFMVLFVFIPSLVFLSLLRGFSKKAQTINYIFDKNSGEVCKGSQCLGIISNIKLLQVKTLQRVDRLPSHHLVLILTNGKTLDLLDSTTHMEVVELAKSIACFTDIKYDIVLPSISKTYIVEKSN